MAGVAPQVISTHNLPPQQQVDAWNSWFAPVFHLVAPPEPSTGFLAESRYWSLGGFGLGQVSAPKLRAERSGRVLSCNPVDHWCLTIGKAETRLITSKGTVIVPAGKPFLVSLGAETVSDREADDRLHFYLPRDTFPEIASQLDAACGVDLPIGLGSLLGSFMVGVSRRLPDLTPEEFPHVTEAVRGVLRACFAASPDRIAGTHRTLDAVRLDRIRRIVKRNVDSPDLSGRMLCSALGISRSELYRILKPEGGVAHYIRRSRLHAAWERVADADRNEPIWRIAVTLGFSDPSDFSRSFRREFGVTPSDVRDDPSNASTPEKLSPTLVSFLADIRPAPGAS